MPSRGFPLAGLWCLLALLPARALGAFVRREGVFEILHPPHLAGTFDCSLANFGVPSYGHRTTATLSMLPGFVDGCEQLKADMSDVELALVPLSSRCGPAEQAWWVQLAGAQGVLLFGETSRAPGARSATVSQRIALREAMYEKQVAIPVYQLDDDLGTKLFGQVLTSFGRDSRGRSINGASGGGNGTATKPLLRPIIDLSVRAAVDLSRRAPAADLGDASGAAGNGSSEPRVALVHAPVLDLWLATWRPGAGMETARHALESFAALAAWAGPLEDAGRLRVRVHPPLRKARPADAAGGGAVCIRDGRYCLLSGGDAAAEERQTGEAAEAKGGEQAGSAASRASPYRVGGHAAAAPAPPDGPVIHPALEALSMKRTAAQDLLLTCARSVLERHGRAHEWWSYLSRFARDCVRPLPLDDHDIAMRQAQLDKGGKGGKSARPSAGAPGSAGAALPSAPSSAALLAEPAEAVKRFGDSECALSVAFDMRVDLKELKDCAGGVTKLDRDFPLAVVDDDLVAPPLGGLPVPIVSEPLPAVFVNGKPHGGRLETATLKAQICAEYREGGEPAACLESALELNECAANLDPCWRSPNGDDVSACVDTFRGYVCKCPVGYRGNGRACEDVDECAVGLDYGVPGVDPDDAQEARDAGGDAADADIPSHGCSQRCVNMVGGYRCACLPGYRLTADSDGGPPGTCELDVPVAARLAAVAIASAVVTFAIVFAALRARRAALLRDYSRISGSRSGPDDSPRGSLASPLGGSSSESAAAAFVKRMVSYGIAPPGSSAGAPYGFCGYGTPVPAPHQVAMSSFYEPIEDADAEVGRWRRWALWQRRGDPTRCNEGEEVTGAAEGGSSPAGSRESSLGVPSSSSSPSSPGASTPGEGSDAEGDARGKRHGRGRKRGGGQMADALPVAAASEPPPGPGFPSTAGVLPAPPFLVSSAEPIPMPRGAVEARRPLESESSGVSSADASTPGSSLSKPPFLFARGSRSSFVSLSSDWSETSVDVAKAAAREDSRGSDAGPLGSPLPEAPQSDGRGGEGRAQA